MFECDEAPASVDDPQELIVSYLETGDRKYFRWYLHFSEHYISVIAKRFADSHGLYGCLSDLKMTAAEIMWERLGTYSFSAGTTFITYTYKYILNAMENFASEVSGGFSSAGTMRYRRLRRALAIYNSSEDLSADERIEDVAKQLGVSVKLAKGYVCWALANKNVGSTYSSDDSSDSFLENLYTLDDTTEGCFRSTADAVAAKLDREVLFDALDELDERDRMMILDHNGICPICGKSTQKKSFEELSDDYQLASEDSARKVYLRALDNYLRVLVKKGFCHSLTIKRTAIRKHKGQTVFVSYEYKPDFEGACGIIECDFSDNADGGCRIVRYAENDDYDVFAERAVRMIRSMRLAEQKKRICSDKVELSLSGVSRGECFIKDKTVAVRADSSLALRAWDGQNDK